MRKCVVFDLDGTLVDTIADIAYAANHSLEILGYPTCPEDSYRYKIGNGMKMICKRALPEDADEETLNKMIALYDEYYKAHCCVRSLPYPGMVELVGTLVKNGIAVGVISNKPHPQTMIVLDTLFPNAEFAYIEGQSERFARKPDPEVLFDCMQRLGYAKEETMYIGDSDVDIQFAHAAGITGVGVSWGLRGEAELAGAGADFIAHDEKELEAYLLK